MKNIYIDTDFKCHVTNDGTMTMVETNFFDEKCDTYIEGFRFIPEGQTWVRKDGKVFIGQMISPWRNYDELHTAQVEYEQKQLVEANAIIAELDAALLDITYNNLILTKMGD